MRASLLLPGCSLKEVVAEKVSANVSDFCYAAVGQAAAASHTIIKVAVMCEFRIFLQ
jgi:hypothetical protein